MVWNYRRRSNRFRKRGLKKYVARARPRGFRYKYKFSRRCPLQAIVPTVMPDSYVCKLRFSEHITLNPATDVAVTSTYGANCLYDPYLGVGGHQPKGYDELLAFYQRAYVMASKITMTPIESTVANVSPVSFYGVAVCDDVSTEITGRTWESLREDKLISRKIRCAGNNVAFTNLANFNSASIRYGYKKFWGKRTELTDSDFENTALANPTRVAQFGCWACGFPGGLVDSAEQTYLIDIEYLVMFKDLQVMPQS